MEETVPAPEHASVAPLPLQVPGPRIEKPLRSSVTSFTEAPIAVTSGIETFKLLVSTWLPDCMIVTGKPAASPAKQPLVVAQA